jgi:hypothetical protein
MNGRLARSFMSASPRLREATVSAGDHVFAADQTRQSHDPLCHKVGMLNDHAR